MMISLIIDTTVNSLHVCVNDYTYYVHLIIIRCIYIFLFFQESVNNKELRMYLKKMEKQITDLQRRQSKVLGGVGGTNY